MVEALQKSLCLRYLNCPKWRGGDNNSTEWRKTSKKMKSKGFQPMIPSYSSSQMDNFDDHDAMDTKDKDDDPDDLPEGPIVCYLYVDNLWRHIGKGILHNRPKEILHGVPLQEGYARIQFEVTVDSEIHSAVP